MPVNQSLPKSLALLVGVLLVAGCSGKHPEMVSETAETQRPSEISMLKLEPSQILGVEELMAKPLEMDGFRVEARPGTGPEEQGASSFRIAYRGRTVFSREIGPYSQLYVIDLNRDEKPELYLEDYSGGAHCCFQHIILALQPDEGNVRVLLDWDGRDVSLEGTDSYIAHFYDSDYANIVTFDARFAYLDYSFAASTFPLKIFSYRDGKYQAATADFPELVRETYNRRLMEYEEAVDEYDRTGDDFLLENLRARAVELYVYSVLLKEEQKALQEIGAAGEAGADIGKWLESRTGKIRELLNQSPY